MRDVIYAIGSCVRICIKSVSRWLRLKASAYVYMVAVRNHISRGHVALGTRIMLVNCIYSC